MVISLAITEIILIGLTFAATSFIAMALTHLPFHEIPVYPVVIGTLILYTIRIVIRQLIRRQNILHYKRLKSDDHIKVYKEPKKFGLWKYLMGVFLILVVIFLFMKCSDSEGLKNLDIPIPIYLK